MPPYWRTLFWLWNRPLFSLTLPSLSPRFICCPASYYHLACAYFFIIYLLLLQYMFHEGKDLVFFIAVSLEWCLTWGAPSNTWINNWMNKWIACHYYMLPTKVDVCAPELNCVEITLKVHRAHKISMVCFTRPLTFQIKIWLKLFIVQPTWM